MANKNIKDLFDPKRSIDRPIEKVITYSNESKLQAEVSEYVVTDRLEESFQDLLQKMRLAMENPSPEGGHEIGVWVSGFYGSGKSSFTKYLGFALDRTKKLGDRLFLEHLQDRLHSQAAKALFGTVSKILDAHVVFLDLASEMATGGGMAEVSAVLRNKVLRDSGYANDIKVAELEILLEKEHKIEEFKKAVLEELNTPWENVHNQPLVANTVGARLAHRFFPKIWTKPEEFANVRIDSTDNERHRVLEMVELVKRKTGKKNIIFIVDEVGQYVAAKNSLILNLDGFAKSLKEIGKGSVWLFATAQQTLTEDNRQASINSPDLYKLKDRFPIQIHLEATDIKEICHKRLLGKSPEGNACLDSLFAERGPSIRTATQLRDAQYYDSQLDKTLFRDLYPFLPSHFEILLQLLGKLARRTGGLGLRSAIKVLQDMLLDRKHSTTDGRSLSEKPVGTLSTTVTFYDCLEKEIVSSFPSITDGVQRVKERFHGKEDLYLDVAKTIAILQIIENLPATSNNIAALIQADAVKIIQDDLVEKATRDLKADSMVPLGEKDGRFSFLSKAAIQLKSELEKTDIRQAESRACIHDAVKSNFTPLPQARLGESLGVTAGIKVVQKGGSPASLDGEKQTLQWLIDFVDSTQYEEVVSQRLSDSHSKHEAHHIHLLARNSQQVDELALEAARCKRFLDKYKSSADQDVKEYVKQVQLKLDQAKDDLVRYLRGAMLKGSFIFKGNRQSVESLDLQLDKACQLFLKQVAMQIYSRYEEAPLQAQTGLAETFLKAPLAQLTIPQDPLGLMKQQGGKPILNQAHKALLSIQDYLKENSDGVEGSRLLDHFSSPPFGWSKDTTRYLLAALLTGGILKLRVAGAEHVTRNDETIKVLSSNKALAAIKVDLREIQPDPAFLICACDRLKEITGTDVLPLEEDIAKVAKKFFPQYQIDISNFASRLSSIPLMDSRHSQRARELTEQLADILAGDGTNAIFRLGTEESPVYQSLLWARRTIKELKQGLENTLRRIGAANSEWKSVPTDESTESHLHFASQEMAKITSILSEDHFFTDWASLQTSATALDQALKAAKTALIQQHNDALKQFVEALPEISGYQELNEDERTQLNALAGSAELPFVEIIDKSMPDIMNRLYQSKTAKDKLEEKAKRLIKEAVDRKDRQVTIPKQKYPISYPSYVTQAHQITSIIAELEKLRASVDGTKAIHIVWNSISQQDA